MTGDYTEKITLPSHKLGDEWQGVFRIGPILIDGETPASPLSRIRMHFVSRAAGITYRLDSNLTPEPNAPITINNAANWDAAISKVANFLPAAGDWDWDMEFYSTGQSTPLTLYKGTLRVYNDVTK